MMALIEHKENTMNEMNKARHERFKKYLRFIRVWMWHSVPHRVMTEWIVKRGWQDWHGHKCEDVIHADQILGEIQDFESRGYA